jgi:hypothetical protein
MKKIIMPSLLAIALSSASTAFASEKNFGFCPNNKDEWKWYTTDELSEYAHHSGYYCPGPWPKVEKGVHMPDYEYHLVTNNSTPYSMWVTIYDLAETTQKDYGCVSSQNTRMWASGKYAFGQFYKVRAEVKSNADCTGETYFDTKYQIYPNSGRNYLPWHQPADVISNLVYTGTSYYWVSGNDAAGPNNAPKLPKLTAVVIQSKVDGKKVLSVDKKNPECKSGGKEKACNIIIDEYKSGDPAQIWERKYEPNGMTFQNRLTGMLLWTDNGNGANATLVNSNVIDGGSKWTLGGDCSVSCALRPQRDSGQNLNVFGGGPYNSGNPVGTWEWGNGAANESWFFVEAEIKPVIIYSRIMDTKVLSVDKNDPKCQPGSSDLECSVVIDNFRQGDLGQVWDRVYQNGGLSLQNRHTGKLLWTDNGNGARATLVSPSRVDGGSVWSVGGDCNTNCALRPQRDDGQNLNVFGGSPYKPGNAVGTWEWGGGGANETWFFGNAPK